MRASRIAAIVGLSCAGVSVPTVATDSVDADLRAFIERYDRAFNAKDLIALASFYHADVTIFEGGHVNTGWVDYRDNHLGPELNQMAALEFAHVAVVPHVLSENAAYVTAEYRLKTRIEGKPVEIEGLETLVLALGDNHAWKIRHSHTSSRRKPAANSPPPK